MLRENTQITFDKIQHFNMIKELKEISKLGRATQGVKIMNVKEETNIISLAKVARQDELEKEIKEDEEPKEGEQIELK